MRDARLQTVLRVLFEQLRDSPLERVRSMPPKIAERRTEGRAMFYEQPVRRDALGPAHEPYKKDASAPAERGQRRVEETAADGIETHVGTRTVRERHDALRELLRDVVDGRVRAALRSE